VAKFGLAKYFCLAGLYSAKNSAETSRPGLADTRMSPFWITLQLRMTGGGDNDGSYAKLQSNCHHQQTKIQFLTGRMPFLSPNQQCQSSEGKSTGLWLAIGNKSFLTIRLPLVIFSDGGPLRWWTGTLNNIT